jgi:hypothetical protein
VICGDCDAFHGLSPEGSAGFIRIDEDFEDRGVGGAQRGPNGGRYFSRVRTSKAIGAAGFRKGGEIDPSLRAR